MSELNYFRKLNYSIGDEDSSIEKGVVSGPGLRILCPAGSGARLIPLLATRPAELTCVDISEEQINLAKLRLLALKIFEHQDYLKIFGYVDCSSAEMLALVEQLETAGLESEIIHALRINIQAGDKVIYSGGFEKMLISMHKIITIFLKRSVGELFEQRSLEDQSRFYAQSFSGIRWKIILFLLANGNIFNALLYGGQFPKKTSKKSYFAIYREMFEKLLMGVSARASFFLQLLLLGRLKYEEGYPLECDAVTFYEAKQALKHSKVTVQHEDLYRAAEQIGGLNFVSVSDIPSFENDGDESYLQRLIIHLQPGGIVLCRSHVRHVEPIIRGFSEVTDRYQLLFQREVTGLWKIRAFEKGDN